MSEQTIIIGGGMAGITAAVELAEAGRRVTLVAVSYTHLTLPTN